MENKEKDVVSTEAEQIMKWLEENSSESVVIAANDKSIEAAACCGDGCWGCCGSGQ